MTEKIGSTEQRMETLRFVDSLPEINDTDGFLVLWVARGELLRLWTEFIYITLETLNLYSTAAYTRDIPKFFSGQLPMDRLNHTLRTQLGMVKEIPVVGIEKVEGGFEGTMKMDLARMAEIYFDGPGGFTAKGYSARAILDRFFGYLWVKEMLLYPIRHPDGYQRPAMWKRLLASSIAYLGKDASLMKAVQKRFEPMEGEVSRPRKYRENAISNLIVSTGWRSVDDVTEEGLVRAERLARDRLGKGRLFRFARLTINDIRLALIDAGRSDILPPASIAARERSVPRPFPHLMAVNPETDRRILDLMEKGELFLAMLEKEGMAKGSREGFASSMNTLFRYLIRHYPQNDIDGKLVDEIYDPENPHSLPEYIRSSGVKENTVVVKMRQISSFLDFCGLYTPSARKNTPAGKRGEYSRSARKAMPAEMVAHIREILLERPPGSPTRWLRRKADASWWRHDVWPVYPLLFLFLYSVPLRGGQVRHLCRERSFVLNEEGTRIERFVINTDKNVHRDSLLEIPCAWEELQIFVPFLRWHREYFPHLEKIVYNNDPNAPWDEIEPVMILPDSNIPLSKNAMMDYHKRLLCRYQLEKMKEAEETGGDYPMVAWSRSGRPFFSDFDELDAAGTARMKDIEVAYDIHSLRVTGATRYLEAGMSIPHLMMLTGHTTPDVLLSVYVRLTEEERRNALKSAIRNIRFDRRENAAEAGRALIREEMVEAYEEGGEALGNAFRDNGLFSLPRKGTPEEERGGGPRPGVEIAGDIHPSNWRPMVHGICPATRCPDGRENRCSLCPYFVTGRLFLDGIVFMANMAHARFQRGALEAEREREKGRLSPAKAEEQEIILEEILGYHEILEKIEEEIDRTEKNGGAGLPVPESARKRVLVEKMPETMAYLRNAYEAAQFGVDGDRFGMKVLTIRAMKIAAESGDSGRVPELADSPEKAVDYIMDYYTGNPGTAGIARFRGFVALLENRNLDRK